MKPNLRLDSDAPTAARQPRVDMHGSSGILQSFLSSAVAHL